MPRRPSLPKDPSQRAKTLLDIATGKTARPAAPVLTEAQKFAQKGGLKGGAARSQKLSKNRRREIARAAAKIRWGTDDNSTDR